MNKKYRIALIGCGSMGAAHLDDICQMSHIELSCVCDINLERAQSFARQYHASSYETNWRKVVASDNVDIVIICTYPSTHLEILEECIHYGKHVLCEKPVTQDIESGEKFFELVRSNPQIKVLVGYILRHNKTYQKVAEMIQSGAIGFPIVMRMTQNHHTMDWQKYFNLICETSPIVDCGVHYLDVMRWFTGAEIREVNGIGLKTEADIPNGKYNYGLMTVRMSDGSMGYYEAGWGNTVAAENLKEFIGPKGRIRITLQMSRATNQEEGDLIEYYTYPEEKYETINLLCKRKPTGDQLNALISMIEGKDDVKPTIEDVQKSFLWANKADEIIKKSLPNKN